MVSDTTEVIRSFTYTTMALFNIGVALYTTDVIQSTTVLAFITGVTRRYNEVVLCISGVKRAARRVIQETTIWARGMVLL